jgi:hypothetical protein
VKHNEKAPFEKKIRIFLFVPSRVCDFSGMFCFYYPSQSISNAYAFLEEEDLRKHFLALEVLESKWAEEALLGT